MPIINFEAFDTYAHYKNFSAAKSLRSLKYFKFLGPQKIKQDRVLYYTILTYHNDILSKLERYKNDQL